MKDAKEAAERIFNYHKWNFTYFISKNPPRPEYEEVFDDKKYNLYFKRAEYRDCPYWDLVLAKKDFSKYLVVDWEDDRIQKSIIKRYKECGFVEKEDFCYDIDTGADELDWKSGDFRDKYHYFEKVK